MLQAIIIEDEKSAMETLISSLEEITPAVEITARLGSVKESIQFMKDHPPADIIFSDVQLTDGLSFEIFTSLPVQVPVIFITGYDEFMMKAFEYNGIDYLLKPVEKKDLCKSLSKYYNLQKHFSHQLPDIHKLNGYLQNHNKKRLLVKKGTEMIPLRIDEISLFYTENKLVFALDRCGKKYMTDRKLTELEMELDPAIFFRANRQYLININYVKGFKSFEKVKLQLDLRLDDCPHQIIISQETAPAFRRWISES